MERKFVRIISNDGRWYLGVVVKPVLQDSAVGWYTTWEETAELATLENLNREVEPRLNSRKIATFPFPSDPNIGFIE